MQGRSLKKDTRNKLAEIGLGGTNGEIRVITDLPMIASNATKVAKNRKRGLEASATYQFRRNSLADMARKKKKAP